MASESDEEDSDFVPDESDEEKNLEAKEEHSNGEEEEEEDSEIDDLWAKMNASASSNVSESKKSNIEPKKEVSVDKIENLGKKDIIESSSLELKKSEVVPLESPCLPREPSLPMSSALQIAKKEHVVQPPLPSSGVKRKSTFK